MEPKLAARTGARYSEKNPAHLAQRNGYRELDWQTQAEAVELKTPKLHQGSYFPSFPEPRRLTEKASTAVIQDAYIQGERWSREFGQSDKWTCGLMRA